MQTEMSKHADTSPPRGHIEIHPGDFADLKDKPQEPVLAGLRILSIHHRQSIPKLVEQYSGEYGVGQNEAEMRLCVSYMLCDANNISAPFRLFTRPQDQVFTHLTKAGARRIFDTGLKLEVETSRLFPEATPDDIFELYSLLENEQLDRLSEADRSTVLRHIRFAYDVLTEVD